MVIGVCVNIYYNMLDQHFAKFMINQLQEQQSESKYSYYTNKEIPAILTTHFIHWNHHKQKLKPNHSQESHNNTRVRFLSSLQINLN